MALFRSYPLFALGVLVLALGCNRSPLFHHLNADGLQQLSSSTPDCPLTFQQLALCASLTWTKQPAEEDGGAFALRFWQKVGGSPSGPFVNPGNQVAVKLWMPSMGHGSSPVKVAPQKDAAGAPLAGVYDASSVYFIMPGDWEIWVQLKQGTQVIDQAKLDYKI